MINRRQTVHPSRSPQISKSALRTWTIGCREFGGGGGRLRGTQRTLSRLESGRAKSKMPRHTAEKKLYPIVERWFRRHFRCFRTGINKGLAHGRIDVVGVRDTGGDLSGEIETIAVEV